MKSLCVCEGQFLHTPFARKLRCQRTRIFSITIGDRYIGFLQHVATFAVHVAGAGRSPAMRATTQYSVVVPLIFNARSAALLHLH